MAALNLRSAASVLSLGHNGGTVRIAQRGGKITLSLVVGTGPQGAPGKDGAPGTGATNPEVAGYIGVSGPTKDALGLVLGQPASQPDRMRPQIRGGAITYRQPDMVSPDDFLPTGTSPASVTDWGPYFQAAYDACSHVHLRGAQDYTINSSVFLDGVVFSTLTTRRGYRLSGDGRSRIIVGTTCSTASGQTFDHGTHWAFFVNTLRSGKNATTPGEVDTTDTTRATGVGLPVGPYLTVENVPIYGTAGQNCGFAYGNGSATLLRSLTLNSLKYGTSWFAYSDGNGMRDIGIIGQPVGGFAMLQTGSGDGVVLHNAKGSGQGILKAFGSRGCRITGGIGGGYEFHGCRGVGIDSLHVELDETNPYPFVVTLDNSQVTVNDPLIYLGKGTQGPAFVIADDTADPYNHSDLTIRNGVFVLFYRPTDSDPVAKPIIRVDSINDGTRVRAENSGAFVTAQGSGVKWRAAMPMFDASAVAAVASAVATGSQQYRLSQRDWELACTANGWELVTE